MTYELGFLDSALKEWRKLDAQIRDQFKKKLAERLDAPHVAASKLSGAKDRYKIKLRSIGYRLVYEVRDTEVIVVVVAVGRRDRNAVYKAAAKRTDTAAPIKTMDAVAFPPRLAERMAALAEDVSSDLDDAIEGPVDLIDGDRLFEDRNAKHGIVGVGYGEPIMTTRPPGVVSSRI